MGLSEPDGRPLVIEVAGVDKHDPQNCAECELVGKLLDIQEAAAAERKKPKRKSESRKKFERELRRAKRLVRARSGGQCEYLHVPTDLGYRRCTWNANQAHHRKRKGQGGSNDIDNLLDLCVLHHNVVHDNIARSIEWGYLIPSSQPERPF